MHLPAAVVQVLFAVQLPVCLYVGYRTARRTGRTVLNWLVYGFLTAIVFPPLGAMIALVVFFVCPPARWSGEQADAGEIKEDAAEERSGTGEDRAGAGEGRA